MLQTVPARWRVMHATVGAVDSILLGDQPTDAFRIGVTIVSNGDRKEADVDAQITYPCRACGWEFSCAGGEDCHS